MPIINHFRPQGTVFVKITVPCRVKGKPVKVDSVVEVNADDAGLITAAGRGVIVDAPKPADPAKDASKK